MDILILLLIFLSILPVFIIKGSIIRKKQVDVPLYHISSISILLIDRFRCQWVSILIVLTVTDVIYLTASLCIIRCQSQVRIKMIHPLSILLISKSLWDIGMWSTNQFIYHCLEYDIEIFGKNIFLGMSIDSNSIRVLKEGIAHIPKLQRLVREILIFYLHEPHLTHTLQIFLELLTGNQFILNIDRCLKSILVVQIVQNTIVDNKQLLLIVHDTFLIDKLQIYWCPILLHKGRRMTDGLRPVNLIITPMQVLDGEKHEVAILLIKPDQRKNDVEISIRMLSLAFSSSGNVLIQDGLAVGVCLVEYTQRTIYPNREFVDKLTVFTAQFFLLFRCHYLLWAYSFSIFQSHPSQHFLFLLRIISQEHLWQNKDTISELWIIEITHILHAHLLIHILQHIDVLQDFLYSRAFVLMFLK